MFIPGHLACAYLAVSSTEYASDSRTISMACLGALLPDIIDKSILFSGLSPFGRTFGHSVIVWMLLFVLVGVFRHFRPGALHYLRFLLIGVLTHILADATDDIVAGHLFTSYPLNAWFTWPFLTPDVEVYRTLPLMDFLFRWTILEFVVCAWAICVMRYHRQRLTNVTSST